MTANSTILSRHLTGTDSVVGPVGLRETTVTEVDATRKINVFLHILQAKDLFPKKVFNCDETRLFLIKLRQSSRHTEKKKHDTSLKDHLILSLCANANVDCRAAVFKVLARLGTEQDTLTRKHHHH